MRSKPPAERIRTHRTVPRKASTNVAWTTPPAPASVDADLWEAIWNLGGPSGIYDPIADAGIIRRYCEMQSRRNMFLDRLNREGFTSTGAAGQEVVHPAARLLAEVEARLPKLEDRLGLSPVARHHVQVGRAVATVSSLEAWLAR